MKYLLIIFSFLNSGCSLFGIRNYEMPEYEVLIEDEDKEIRTYKPYIVAKTVVEGEYDEAQTKAFRILADYIFGNNVSQKEIAMTSPVSQSEESKKISMTAPVVQKEESESIAMTAPVTQKQGNKKWIMTFMMPSEYTMASLPKPKNDKVILEKVEAKTIAAIRFSWFQNIEKNQKKGKKLLAWLAEKNKYKPISEPYFAGYDPPWTLPFFRRHEMMIEVDKIAVHEK